MNSLRKLSVLIFTSLLISSPFISADDTDIYVGSEIVKGNSNILFSIDTSGSMAAHVINYDAVTAGASSSIPSHAKYNPATIYNTAGCFDDSVYQTVDFSNTPIMPYVSRPRNGTDSNDIQPTHYKCVSDEFAVDGITQAVADGNRGLWNRTGVFTGTRISRAYPTTNATCPAAQTALNTVGYFLDENNVCTDGNNIDYDNLLVTGRFLDFVNSLVDDNGYPVDTNGARIPWSQFFVESRLQIVKDVVNDIITNNDNLDINIGLLRFTNSGASDGGLIAERIRPLLNADGSPNANNQNELRTTVNSFVNFSGTPLEETYFEGWRYYSKGEVFQGLGGDTTAVNGNTYISPITHACQKNAIIVLSDGNPNNDSIANTEIQDLFNDAFDPNTNCNGDGQCMNELARFMSETDQRTDDTGLIGPDGKVLTSDLGVEQTITTHTVGFFNNNPILTATANDGQGITRLANNADDLKAFFRETIEAIVLDATTFTAPSISVNSLNRFENLDDLYFSLFEPSNKPLWNGNVKKYEIQNQIIVDANDNEAVDPTTALFKDTSLSFWTDGTMPDGNVITAGGFASRLSNARNVYSDLDSFNLSSTANELNATTLTPQDFGLAAGDTATAQTYIDWLNGVTTDASGNLVSTQTIGDTLHTTPVVVTYNLSGATVTDPSDLDQALFFGTNSGYLHGIDVTPGNAQNMEHFAYFPKEFIKRVPQLYNNTPSGSGFQKLYGLDGPITSWIEGDNNNNIVDSGETAHLFVTMRRGGNSIYSLDVTDYNNPKVEWIINPSTPGFEELGQTWSRLIPTKVNYKGTEKDVLIFAGGYDDDQDDVTVRTADDTGRAIYMVDATDGSLIWRAVLTGSASSSNGDILELADMKYSIPSDIAVSDTNGNGFSNTMHVGDMGGQLWRFDILETGITGGVIADLAGNTSDEHRRFFTAPSVARVSSDAYGNYLSVAVGSGDRPTPKKSTTVDKFYMIKDPYIIAPKRDSSGEPNYDYARDASGTTFSKILDNVSATPVLSDITNNPAPALNEIGPNGWLLDLPNAGEKVLNRALTADGKIFFNTYDPSGTTASSEDPCSSIADIGASNTYVVSLVDGSAVAISDENNPTTAERRIDSSIPGIAPPPQLIITGKDEGTGGTGTGGTTPPGPLTPATCPSTTTGTILVGSRTFNSGICTAPKRTYWNRYEENQ